jgi:hypothetical protein
VTNDDGPDLSDELAAYHRQVLVTHATNPETGACRVCGVPRCPDWISAYDTLAAAHQLMATNPPPWEPFQPRAKPRRSRLPI